MLEQNDSIFSYISNQIQEVECMRTIDYLRNPYFRFQLWWSENLSMGTEIGNKQDFENSINVPLLASVCASHALIVVYSNQPLLANIKKINLQQNTLRYFCTISAIMILQKYVVIR